MPDIAVPPDAVCLPDTQVARDLTFDQARSLLDWLEVRGISKPEVNLEESGLVTIAWPE